MLTTNEIVETAIVHDGGEKSFDIRLTSIGTGTCPISKQCPLRHLATVEVNRVPLALVTSVRYKVTSSASEARPFFDCLLSPSNYPGTNDATPWWQKDVKESPVGVLVSVPSVPGERSGAVRITELLIFATVASSVPLGSNVEFGDVQIHALGLCSEYTTLHGPTPPGSPVPLVNELDAVFLAQSRPRDDDVINEPPVRKRKSVTDTFDEATERHRKARRHGGGGVAAAAAIKAEPCIPPLRHRRTASGAESQDSGLHKRPLSRSPSAVSSRPATSGAQTEGVKRSSLSQVQSLAAPSEPTLEDKNRDTISRMIMAGMRLYGLSQTNARKSRAGSAVASPAIDMTFDERDLQAKKAEEYKLVYHQAFKGTCFAFRQYIRTMNLTQHNELVRDTVDKLLNIFCQDPLEDGLPGVAEELTPGGRKPFAAGTSNLSEGVFTMSPQSGAPG